MPADTDDTRSLDTAAGKPRRSKGARIAIWLVGGLVAIAVLVSAGVFVYIHFIKDDAPKKLSIEDVTITSDATITTSAPSVTAGSTAATVAPSSDSTVATSDSPTATDATASSTAAATGSAQTYALTSDSVAGYRVVEVLFGQDTEGVGRTNSVTGSVTLDGTSVSAATFTVDMTTLVSDESNRDRKFSNEIMETSTFPTATFTITQPIELGTIPADDQEITATATGDLTLHGVTKSVTLDVTAKKTGDNIVIVGSTDVVFSDYDIDNPSNAAVTTEDHGLIEFQLVAALT